MKQNETAIAKAVLGEISNRRGMMWEKIAEFQEQVNKVEGVIVHKAGEERTEIEEYYTPLKQTLEGGLYTRELFMPKGAVIVSMIHKQQHPSFLLKGELSYLTDEGEIKKIKAPSTVFTQKGTQRVFYVHKDSEWCCVYKTDAKTFEEAESDVYVDKFTELPEELINKTKKLWQAQHQ
jgi:hypothetical protein|tara:strand:+ start:11770 stop:12303 length:534 start_codon:yes stop_codon:yes gene_type:complete